MASPTEIRNRAPSEVLKLAIPAQILEPVQTERILSQHSLSYPYIERNMGPNKVAEIRLGGKRWVLIAPHGGYTPTEHLMAMRWEYDYTPDPESIPAQEGEEMMGIFADLAREILKKPYNKKVVWSFHSSRHSFGQEGYQSVPTMFHPSIFGLPEFSGEENPYMSFVDSRELAHKERKSIRGGIYNRYFGRLLTDHALNGHFAGDRKVLNQLFDMDQVQIDHRGVRVPVRGSLEDILMTEGFFKGFLQPLAVSLNRYADDLSIAFTDFNPEYVRQRIEEAVLSRGEPEDKAMQAVLGEITRIPNLLERSVRAQNIQFLKKNGYTDEFVRYLENISEGRLPNSGPATRWKRGFAFTFALYQDKDTAQAVMAISTAVENGPGGVVEGVLGAKLVRPRNTFSEEDIVIKKAVYQELVASLNSCVVRN